MARSKREQLELQLSAYLDGELSAKDREAVEAILAADADARRLLRELQVIAEAIHKLPRARADDTIMEAVRARLERSALLADQTPIENAPLAGRSSTRWLAAAAMIAMTALAGYVIWPLAHRQTATQQLAMNDAKDKSPAAYAPAAAPRSEQPQSPRELDKDMLSLGTPAGGRRVEKAVEAEGTPPSAPPASERQAARLGDAVGVPAEDAARRPAEGKAKGALTAPPRPAAAAAGKGQVAGADKALAKSSETRRDVTADSSESVVIELAYADAAGREQAVKRLVRGAPLEQATDLQLGMSFREARGRVLTSARSRFIEQEYADPATSAKYGHPVRGEPQQRPRDAFEITVPSRQAAMQLASDLKEQTDALAMRVVVADERRERWPEKKRLKVEAVDVVSAGTQLMTGLDATSVKGGQPEQPVPSSAPRQTGVTECYDRSYADAGYHLDSRPADRPARGAHAANRPASVGADAKLASPALTSAPTEVLRVLFRVTGPVSAGQAVGGVVTTSQPVPIHHDAARRQPDTQP